MERWRLLATGGDDLVGGVLQPGAQAAGQARFEAGSRRGVTTEQGEHLRAAGPVGRGGGTHRTRGDEDHRGSVPTGCDTPYPGKCMAPALVPPALATDAAFFAIFGIFVVALLVLAVIVIVWAVRHDVAGRQAWRERQQTAAQRHPPPPPGAAP